MSYSLILFVFLLWPLSRPVTKHYCMNEWGWIRKKKGFSKAWNICYIRMRLKQSLHSVYTHIQCYSIFLTFILKEGIEVHHVHEGILTEYSVPPAYTDLLQHSLVHPVGVCHVTLTYHILHHRVSRTTLTVSSSPIQLRSNSTMRWLRRLSKVRCTERERE